MKTSLCNCIKFGRSLHGARNFFWISGKCVKCKQMDIQTDDRPQWSEKIIWFFSWGELKLYPRHTFLDKMKMHFHKQIKWLLLTRTVFGILNSDALRIHINTAACLRALASWKLETVFQKLECLGTQNQFHVSVCLSACEILLEPLNRFPPHHSVKKDFKFVQMKAIDHLTVKGVAN